MNLLFHLKPITAAVLCCGLAGSFGTAATALEEVVVTAQKRSESMQNVPIAVTAMNAEMLKKAGVSNVKGVAVRTPGFSMGEFNPTQPQLYIRGIGSNGDGAASGEGSVAMFIDGAYVNRSAGTGMELFDIESIEVLRGPQGTLWGKNAIAGAINVTTTKPSDELVAALEATVGNLGLTNYRGMVSGPLAENLNGKISFNKKDRDGYIDSVIEPDVEQGWLDTSSIRAQLLHTPTDTLELLLTLNYSEDRRSGAAARPTDNLVQPGFAILGASLLTARANGVPVAGFHESYADYDGNVNSDNHGASLKIDWDTTLGTVTSLTAYGESKASFDQNLFGVAPEILRNYGPLSQTALGPFGGLSLENFMAENTEIFSQEFRLAGETDQLVWQAGIYYNSENIYRLEGNRLEAPAFSATVVGFPNALRYTPAVAQAAQFNETTSFALFGQATYSVTERLDLTLGLRYTEESKDYRNEGSFFSTQDPTAPVLEDNWSNEETWRAPTYKLVANYHLNDDAMIYLSAATGFKSGGFGYSSPLSPATADPFNEENALNIELGLKSMLLDDRLRLNGALFRTDYEDLQILQQFPCDECAIPPLITKNAGKALSQGIELEATFALSDEWQLMASYAFLDTEYTELDGNLAADEGNALRNAPRNTYALSTNYEKDLASGGYISARLEYLHKEKAYQDTKNYEFAAIPEYRLFNGRLAYTTADEQWELAAWVDNLMDEEYFIHNYQAPPFGAIHIAGLPRTYGLTVTWNSN